MNDLIADLLARIQNAIMRKEKSVEVPLTKINKEILRVLKQEEMIEDYEELEKTLDVKLAYEGKEATIMHLEKVSKLGQRVYVSKKEIIPVMNGRGISIISTSEGLMTGAQAKSKKLGGELICKVW